MSAATVSSPTTLSHTFDISSTPRITIGRLAKVELRKSLNTRAGLWLLIGMAALTAVIYVVMLIIAALGKSNFGYNDFVASAAFGTSVLLPVMAILLVTSEWTQRTTLTTFALEPHRPRVLVAKLITAIGLTVAVTAFAMVAGVLANVINGLVANSAPWTFGWHELVGFVITQTLAMLGGFAFATLFLNSPAAIVAFFVYKWILPTLFTILSQLSDGVKHIVVWLDFQGAQTHLGDLTMSGKDWNHLLVTGVIWLVIPFALGLRRVLRAEVK